MNGTLHVTSDQPGVVLLEIDRPPMNALDVDMFHLMRETFSKLEADTSVRAAVITGRGKAFCSGEDLKLMSSSTEELELFGALLDQIEASRFPVIAAINGFCVGGGFELALCSDIRLASTAASFTCAGVNVGLLGGTYRLPRAIGIGRAKEMEYSGAKYDAVTVERFGLVASVHEPGELLPSALRMAARIATRAPLSVEAAKRMIGRAHLAPEVVDKIFYGELSALLKTQDHQEALAAFRDRREPKFERR